DPDPESRQLQNIVGLMSIDTGVFGGIIVGGMGAYLFNRFYRIELPSYLAFFAGKRFVPIITGLCAIVLGVGLSYLWPPVQKLITMFSNWAAYSNPTMAGVVYGFIERLLLPFGLHHAWNVPFFFEIGSYVAPGSNVVIHGDINRFFAGDPTAGILSGGFLTKMWGLPAAAIAMWHSARPENRKRVGGIMVSAALTSVLITLVILSRNSEIVAFKGSGISLWRLSAPFVFSALLLSALAFALGNVVTPRTSIITNEIWDGLVRNKRPDIARAVLKDIWIRDVRLLEHFDSYDEDTSEARGVSMLLFDDDLKLEKRIEAERAVFSEFGVTLANTESKTYQNLDEDGYRRLTLERARELFLPDIPAPPPGLGFHRDINSDELDVWALRDNIGLLRAEGFNPVRQLVDLQFKFSRPFITLIVIMVGLPIGFWREKGGSIAMGLIPGLILSFLYMVFLEVSRTIGYAGLLPPFVAAWLPNCFFLLLGLYLFSYIRQ
ncbi:MAG: LptF/LptG family permease, partial [Deltaproteobacteria bacterium]|nr:LptF/LptG family permease [Deltaproteobacteria bacterium]